MDSIFFEKYVDLLKNLPSDVKRNLNLLHDIDRECADIEGQLFKLTDALCTKVDIRTPIKMVTFFFLFNRVEKEANKKRLSEVVFCKSLLEDNHGAKTLDFGLNLFCFHHFRGPKFKNIVSKIARHPLGKSR